MNNKIGITLVVLLALAIGLTVSVGPLKAQGDLSQEEQNIETVLQYLALLDQDVSQEDLQPFLAGETLPFHGMNPEGEAVDVPASLFAQAFQGNYVIWPDFAHEVENIAAQGDMVIVRERMSGTFTGELGPNNYIAPGESLEPDNEFHEWDSVTIFRCEDGQITEFWYFWNNEFVAAHTR